MIWATDILCHHSVKTQQQAPQSRKREISSLKEKIVIISGFCYCHYRRIANTRRKNMDGVATSNEKRSMPVETFIFVKSQDELMRQGQISIFNGIFSRWLDSGHFSFSCPQKTDVYLLGWPQLIKPFKHHHNNKKPLLTYAKLRTIFHCYLFYLFVAEIISSNRKKTMPCVLTRGKFPITHEYWLRLLQNVWCIHYNRLDNTKNSF